MGYTSHTVDVIEEVLIRYKPKSILDLGAQNMYNQPNLPAPYAKEWYEQKGISYTSIDINSEHGAIPVDMSKPIFEQMHLDPRLFDQYDLLCDCGTSEHVSDNGVHGAEAFYNCWVTKHNLLKIGGIMISENPMTGNWPGHGQNYVTQAFYKVLCKMAAYELIHLHEHPAMGNTTDGWNVVCVLQKTSNEDFISFDQFKLLDFRGS